MYFVPKGELVLELRDSTDSLIFEKREKLTISSASSWEKLISDLEIEQDGELTVFIDNASADKVYFDEFIIERTEAAIAVVVQENHYYPFGMNMKGIEELDLQSLNSKDEHRWQFNGVEKNESFGLNWNETFYRTYDMQLGRWNHIDPKPTYSQTTYMGMGNNPVSYSDALGDSVNLELIRRYDAKNGTNFLQTILDDFSTITGMSFSLDQNGFLTYDKNEDGTPKIEKELCSCEHPKGSQKARDLIINAIDHKETAYARITTATTSSTSGKMINLNPNQINSFIQGANNLDSRTLGWGMTLLHETLHSIVNGNLRDNHTFGKTGDVVDQMNVVRAEMNRQGYNFGQRVSYPGMILIDQNGNHSPSYLPFDTDSLKKLKNSAKPDPTKKYITI